MATTAATATVLVEGLVRCADRRDASLRLNRTVFHITCACAPKIF